MGLFDDEFGSLWEGRELGETCASLPARICTPICFIDPLVFRAGQNGAIRCSVLSLYDT